MVTKTCKGCAAEKSITEFYKQPSNKDGLKTLCKPCQLNRYETVEEGELSCKRCLQVKPYYEFTPHRVSRSGRSTICKACKAHDGVTRRRLRPVYHPATGRVVSIGEYIKRDCAICGQIFEPIRNRQLDCHDCSNLCRRLGSRLTSERGKPTRSKVPYSSIRTVAFKYFWATHCVYCARAFDVLVTKSLDHADPICLGGDPADASNVVISCLDCNRCKQWLGVHDWVALCRLVVINADPAFIHALEGQDYFKVAVRADLKQRLG